VTSAEPYASLHLVPDRYPCQHLTTQFLQAACPSCRPTNSVKALKANRDKLDVAENSFLQAQLSKHTVFVGIITKKVTIFLSIC